jgi:HSP20 family protein
MKRNLYLPSLLDSRSQFVTSFDKLFDQMMNDSFPTFTRDYGVEFFGKSAFPKVNVLDTTDSIEIHAEIPGLSKEEVEIKLEPGNILFIKGEKKPEETADKAKTYIIRELKHSSFVRRFILGENLNPKDMKAKFVNGVLEITIPKKEKKEETSILIDIE